MWNKVCASHIVMVYTGKKHNYCGCAFPAVCNMLCSVSVCVRRSLKMVCDMWKARGHSTESYWFAAHIRFSCFPSVI